MNDKDLTVLTYLFFCYGALRHMTSEALPVFLQLLFCKTFCISYFYCVNITYLAVLYKNHLPSGEFLVCFATLTREVLV